MLEAIAPLSPETRSMFGCLAVYVEDKIVLILREKRDVTEGNGVWLDTTEKLPAVDFVRKRSCHNANTPAGAQQRPALSSRVVVFHFGDIFKQELRNVWRTAAARNRERK